MNQEIVNKLINLLNTLHSEKDSYPFLQPVRFKGTRASNS